MAHVFFIDPLEKLSLKKDSSLMLAATLQSMGQVVKILFEPDFYIANNFPLIMKQYNFTASFKKDGCYLDSFIITDYSESPIQSTDTIHMRIDPPFDGRYLRYLWMLKFLQSKGIKIINSPDGILKYNEKLHAYLQPSALPSYIGSSLLGFMEFVSKLSDTDEIILKPLDLYQGMGVEKLAIKNNPHLADRFQEKVKENQGPIVAQIFCKAVEKGEVRSLYFKGKELGSILKIPKQGDYLANIAQGANFHSIELSANIKSECELICKDLMSEGVDWVAFDILDNHVSEINITCPGLLVEVSYAHQKNLAQLIGEQL